MLKRLCEKLADGDVNRFVREITVRREGED
jgi:hypothetical protein